MAFMTLSHPDSVLTVLTVDKPTCIITGCQDRIVRIWDGASWSCVQELEGHKRAVLSLAAHDGILVSSGADSQICLWDMSGGLPRSHTVQREGPTIMQAFGGFIGIGRYKLSAGSIYSLKIVPWEVSEAGMEFAVYAGCQDTSVYRIVFRLVLNDTSASKSAKSYSIQTLGVGCFSGACGFTYSLLLRPSTGDDNSALVLYSGAGDGIIRVWDAKAELTNPDALSARFAPVENVLDRDKRPREDVHVVRSSGILQTTTTLRYINLAGVDIPNIAAVGVVTAASLADILKSRPAPHLPEAISDPADDDSVAGDAEEPDKQETAYPGTCGAVYALQMHGNDIYSGAQDGNVRVFDASTGHMKYILTGHTKEVLALCILEDSSRPRGYFEHVASTQSDGGSGSTAEPALLCSGSADHTLRIWSVRTYMCLQVIHEGLGSVLGLAGYKHMLYAACNNATVKGYDTATLKAPPGSSTVVATPRPAAFMKEGNATVGSSVFGKSFDADQLKQILVALLADNPTLLPSLAQAPVQEQTSSLPSIKSSSKLSDADPMSSASDVAGTKLDIGSALRADLSQQALLSCMKELVAIPSVSLDSTSHSRDVQACWRAAQYVHDVLLRIGAECRMVQGVPGSNPIVLGRIGGWDVAVPTICLQATYDVQPPGDMSAWLSPPFELSGRDGYLYARGATDNKGPLLAMIFAVARFLRHCAEGGKGKPPCNFVFVIEGEGENGSLGFREAILQNLEWFANTQVIVNCNNTWIGETVPCLTYGMRGLVKLRVEISGPSTDLHSGLDGGVCHEPLLDLCALLGSLTEPTSGKIAVAGIYDQIASFSAEELGLYKDVDFDVEAFMAVRGLHGVYTTCHHPEDGSDADTRPAKRKRTDDFRPDAGADTYNAKAMTVNARNMPAMLLSPESVDDPAHHGFSPAANGVEAVMSPAAAALGKDVNIDVGASVLLRRWREPALTVHGITCSIANDSIIPKKAVGFVSVRTVPNMASQSTFEELAHHLQREFAGRRSPNKLTVAMISHAAWWLQSPSAPHFQAAARAIQAHWGRQPIFVREGGTVRVTTFLEKTLGAPAIHIPIGQSSDAPHLPNERIRLLNLVVGVKVLETFFQEMATLHTSAPATHEE